MQAGYLRQLVQPRSRSGGTARKRPCPRFVMGSQRHFRSARSVAGFVPDQVTTDGHNSYPRAIRSTLGNKVRHWTGVYLNNRLEQTIAGSRGASDVCAASRSMTRQTDSAESAMNSATFSAADLVTTNAFQRPADAVAFSTTPGLPSASWRLLDQCIEPARYAANGAKRDKTGFSRMVGIIGTSAQPSLDDQVPGCRVAIHLRDA